MGDQKNNIQQFTPGTYSVYNINDFSNHFSENEINYACKNIRKSLINAVIKRIDNTQRDIACLLSGGLDSSLIAALVNEHKKDNKKLSTWSIGLKGSEDLKYA